MTLSSSRYHDEMRQIKLYAARMLYRSFLDYVHYKKWSNGRRPKNKRDRREKAIFEDAKAWIFDGVENDASSTVDVEDDFISQIAARTVLESFDHVMNFETACGILGWDPDWVRRRIPDVTAANLKKVGKRNGFL